MCWYILLSLFDSQIETNSTGFTGFPLFHYELNPFLFHLSVFFGHTPVRFATRDRTCPGESTGSTVEMVPFVDRNGLPLSTGGLGTTIWGELGTVLHHPCLCGGVSSFFVCSSLRSTSRKTLFTSPHSIPSSPDSSPCLLRHPRRGRLQLSMLQVHWLRLARERLKNHESKDH